MASEDKSANQLTVIAQGKWRQALFTTFTLNLGFFEAYVLPRLYEARCDEITILVDEAFYLATLAESGARHVGTAYRVFPVAINAGVFHAKVTYLSGEHGDDVLMIGSGNITWAGYGHQLECLDVLRASRDSAAFGDFSEILRLLLKRDSVHLGASRSWVEAVAERASRAAARASSASTQVRVIGSVSQSITDQVVDFVAGSRPFEKLIAMSPFHAGDAGPLRRISNRLGFAEVEVAVDGHSLATPVREGIKNLSFVRRDVSKDTRPTHAKWYEFIGPQPWLLSGSVNATPTSLESTDNFEIATLRPVVSHELGEWKPCKPTACGVPPPPIVTSVGRLALTAALESAHAIKGQFISVGAENEGTWDALLLVDGVERHLSAVQVTDGCFDISVSQGVAVEQAEPCQLRLIRDGVTATGWLMFESELHMSREEREFSRRVRRLSGGVGDSQDFIGVINWLAERVSQLIIGGPKKAGAPGKVDEPLPAPTGPFDYKKWISQAKLGGEHGFSDLGACRTALDALARFVARPIEVRDDVGLSSDQPQDFNLGDDGIPNDPPNPDPDAPPPTSQSLESLRKTLQKALQTKDLDGELATFFLEALLWDLLLLYREGREARLDSVPFAQWSVFARPRLAAAPEDRPLALLALTAMCCAFAFRADDEPRTELFSELARRAATALESADLTDLVAASLAHSPCFFKLSNEQVQLAVQAIPDLMHYEGLVGQLRRFLNDWLASGGNLTPPSELASKTGGVVDELRIRRGMPSPFTTWESYLPPRCPGRCNNIFDASDLSVLRNRRALKCIRCGMLHFWMGIA